MCKEFQNQFQWVSGRFCLKSGIVNGLRKKCHQSNFRGVVRGGINLENTGNNKHKQDWEHEE